MKIPGVAWFFFRVLLPIWNFVWSNLEAMCRLRKRATSVNAAKALRRDALSAVLLGKWYIDKNFTWEQDPLSGFLDFSSKPWVSIARNRGDCDDMMVFSEYVLKNEYDEGHKGFIYASDGRSHAVYLFRSGEEWFMMSNQFVQGPFSSRDDAIKITFGEKTAFSYVV